MQTISRERARQLIAKSNGRFFTVMFTKRTDKTVRTMTCRTGVKKNLKGGEPAYDFTEKNLIPVYDTQAGLKPGDTGYRSIPVEGIHTISINGKDFRVS